ncbi:MAG: hypothetical protein Kow0092_20500 [Deferrisomatales bacterium]
MRKLLILGLCAALGPLGLAGCGGDDFQAGNRLTVVSITDESDNAVPVFRAVVETDDSGNDGDPGTVDPYGSQGNFFPDLGGGGSPGETVLVPLGNDLGKITLQNEARLGVDPGVDLELFRIDLTYFDANGASRTFAPPQSLSVTGVVPNDGTLDLDGVVLVPVEMKTADDGLQEIFLFGTSDEIEAVRQWTVVVDVYARDVRNDDTVHAQGQITVKFIDPMIEGASD